MKERTDGKYSSEEVEEILSVHSEIASLEYDLSDKVRTAFGTLQIAIQSSIERLSNLESADEFPEIFGRYKEDYFKALDKLKKTSEDYQFNIEEFLVESSSAEYVTRFTQNLDDSEEIPNQTPTVKHDQDNFIPVSENNPDNLMDDDLPF